MPSPIQWTTAASGSTTNPQTAAFPNNVVSGHRVFVLSQSNVTTEVVTGITDTRSSTYSQLFDITIDATRFELWSAPLGSSGANTVSVTYSAVTSASKRVWIWEGGDQGTVSAGPSNSANRTSGADPIQSATLTVDAVGVAFTVIRTDDAHVFSAWEDTSGQWIDMGGGSTSRAAFRSIGPSTPNLAPALNVSANETGDVATMAVYDQAAAGGGDVIGARIFTGY